MPTTMPLTYSHQQLTFFRKNPSDTHYHFRKPGTAPAQTPIPVKRKLFDTMELGRKCCWQLRNPGIVEIKGKSIQPRPVKARNQWLDTFPDGRNIVEDYFADATLESNYPASMNSAEKSGTKTWQSGSGACNGLAPLLIDKMHAMDPSLPLFYGATENHVFVIANDSRVEKAAKLDIFGPIPTVEIFDPTHEGPKVDIGPMPNRPAKDPAFFFEQYPQKSDADVDQWRESQSPLPPPGGELLLKIIGSALKENQEHGKTTMWNRLHMGYNPGQPYQVVGESPFSQFIDLAPVDYVEAKVKAPQDKINLIWENHSEILRDAGYDINGSDGLLNGDDD